MKKELKKYIPIAEAIKTLLYPYAEVVIHDLSRNKIAAIFNSFSKRKVGDDSLLEEEGNFSEFPEDFFGPYYKTNWDGKKLKSSTAILKDSNGKAIGLLCINFNISQLVDMQQLLSAFTIRMEKSLPEELFNEDWREKISLFVYGYLNDKGKTLSALTNEEKRMLVKRLHKEGAFRAKNSAKYVGEVLQISRATVYKYLSE